MAEVAADEQVRGRSLQAVLGCPWRVVEASPGNRLGVPARAGQALCAVSPPRCPVCPALAPTWRAGPGARRVVGNGVGGDL